ncbi:uncharacterized protein LOC132906098 [Bombus pascuorum]|uniref:uncharacterized protein LOC132906098 n=1 Tax=Bombus pascuorum TaxID=65598 RepID=UPI00298E8A2D|nr:uncharacterized protein LOC132906098 [Bombus pascuorum]
MVNIAIITRKTTMRSTLLVNIVVLAFLLARLSNMRYSDSALFFRGYFPYNTSISQNFELTIIGQFVATVYAANTYTAIDTFVVLLIFHVCGQLSNLRDDLQKIHSQKDVETKLQKIIQKHEYINRFAITIENSFNMMLLLQMLGCTIQICSQSYQVIMLIDVFGDEKLLKFAIFQSTEIANTAYYAEWYNLPPKSARWLVIIMCRARSSPLQISAGKFCWFTLALYSQVSVNEF